MEWNGRQYRPAGQLIRNRKPDFQDMMRPYGQKQNNGNVWVPVLSIPGNVPQPSSGPSPFDPSSITGLKLWFDADDTSTLLLDGNYVESWTSKGDVPMVLTASTINRRPQYITTGGTGSSPALLFFSSATAPNRSLLTQESTSQSFNLTQGYTIFMAQKNVGNKSAGGLYGSFGTYFYTFGSTTPSVNQNIQLAVQGNNQENFRTGATTGYQLNYTSPGSGTRYYWTPTRYSFKYIGVDYTDMSPSKFYGQDIYSGSPTLTSVSYPTGVTSYTGKTINGMGIGGTNTAGTPSGLLTAPQEVYEILVYDTKLSTNDANQVMDYLRTKWDYVVDLSNTAVFDATVTGKTTNASDYFWFSNFNSPISAVGNFYWTTQGMKFLLDGNTDAYFNTGLATANLGFNYSVSDSGNNIIETATCQKTPTGAILYSAGTYNISIAYDYNCVDPSPTPTPTETITPSPTPTMTPTPSSVPFDSDAAAYLSAVLSAGGTGITPTVSAATNTLFTDLKSNSLYNKLQIFYPFIGGTSASHSIMGNRVSGTTYDINWGGSMTHSVSGVTGVGTTNSWGDTKFFGSGTTLGNRHFSMYSFIQNTSTAYDLSSDENGLILGYGSNSWYGLMDATAYDPMTASSTTGMYVSTEPSLNTQRNFRNGTNSGNFARTSNRYNGVKFIIGSKNSGAGQTKSEQSSRGYNWMSIGLGLSDAEVGNLTTIINTFQTSLSRNVY
jgi:hypothetical protein